MNVFSKNLKVKGKEASFWGVSSRNYVGLDLAATLIKHVCLCKCAYIYMSVYIDVRHAHTCVYIREALTCGST